jgi:hypothetical protein
MMLHAPVGECQDKEARRDRPDLRLSLAMTQPVPLPETAVPRSLAPAARRDLLAMFAHAKRSALECLTEIVEEPYSGDNHHDSALRKAKIAAASVLLSVDVQDAHRIARLEG